MPWWSMADRDAPGLERLRTLVRVARADLSASRFLQLAPGLKRYLLCLMTCRFVVVLVLWILVDA
jgi:hypothetical protein